MFQHFQTLLEGVVANPDAHIADLPRWVQQNAINYSWNQTQCNYSDNLCHQLFEAQAARTPDAIAVAFGDEQLTYQELINVLQKYAHYLQQLGVAEVLVGICVERLEMVVGILGIWKAGGAYLSIPIIRAIASSSCSRYSSADCSDWAIIALLKEEPNL